MDSEDRRILFMKLIPVVVIIIVVLSIVFLIIVSSNKKYIILGNYLIYEKGKFSYKQVNEINDEVTKFKYDVYDGKKVLKDVRMEYLNNRFYLYTKKGVYINETSFRVATHGVKVKLADYNKQSVYNVTNDNYILKFLDKVNIKDKNYYSGYYTAYDFDKDGKDELVYTINNFSLGNPDYKQYGFMFIVQNEEIVYYTDIADSDVYTVMDIVDLDNDGKYELIVNKGNKDLKTFDGCYQVYNLKRGSWKITKDCE